MGAQAELFVQIWEDLEPEERISFVTGMPLPTPYEMRSYYFSHLLSKGAFPAIKLLRENIVLMTFEEHRLWENRKHVLRENKKLYELWRHVFELTEKIKEDYYHGK